MTELHAEVRTNIQIIEMLIDLILEEKRFPDKSEHRALKRALGELKNYVNGELEYLFSGIKFL